MKTFLFSFIFFTLSYAQRFEFLDLPTINLNSITTVDPDNHDDLDHDHHGTVSTTMDRVTEDENVISHIHYFGKNRRPVRLSNRIRFPRTTSFSFPRRCDHNEPYQRFIIPGGGMDQDVVQFMFKKEIKKENKEEEKQKERVVPRGRNGGPSSNIIVPRHVAKKDGPKVNMVMFGKPHLRFGKTMPRHHQVKSGNENIKRGVKKMRSDDENDGFKGRGQEVLYKIRKFLNYF